MQKSTQYIGMILSLIGVSLLAAPNLFGFLMISVITFFLGGIALLGVILALALRTPLFTLIPLIIFFLAVFALFNPTTVLFIIGISLILGGIHTILAVKNRDSMISSGVMILLGLFAFVNAGGGWANVMSVLGSILLAVGLLTFFFGGNMLRSLFRNQGKKYSAGSFFSRFQMPFEDSVFSDFEEFDSPSEERGDRITVFYEKDEHITFSPKQRRNMSDASPLRRDGSKIKVNDRNEEYEDAVFEEIE